MLAPIQIRNDDWSFLRSQHRLADDPSAHAVRIVDLFCGAGGLSVGASEAIVAHGWRPQIAMAGDFSPHAVRCYQANFPHAKTVTADLSTVFDGQLGAPLTETERRTAELTERCDLLLGGPPCQGHSDLNNRTRRNDPKNDLYLLMARATEVLRPEAVVIENVPTSVHAKNGVVQATIAHLELLGYHVTSINLDMLLIGVPQTRSRLAVIGTRRSTAHINQTIARFRTEPRDVHWAIGDLEAEPAQETAGLASQPSRPNRTTQARINFLFDHDLYELPDSERPACHADGQHSYRSVYGRLSWNKPAQTITRGFYSMCMGRYVHPSSRRTLTAHEAARLQFFPDYFTFEPAGTRTAMAELIGNAVPPKAAYVLTAAVAGLFPTNRDRS